MNYVEVLKDLISIDTTVPPGLNYDKAVRYLEPLFKESGFDAQKIVIPAEHAEEGKEGSISFVTDGRKVNHAWFSMVTSTSFRPRVGMLSNLGS